MTGGLAAVAVPPPPLGERRWSPVIVLVAVIGGIVFGGYALAGTLSVPSGRPVSIAGVVRVFPLEGWGLAETFAQPDGARITKGSANLDVAALPFTGTDADLLREYVEEALEPEAEQLSVSEIGTVTLAGGLTGARVVYVGGFGEVATAIEGEVTAVVSSSGVGVIFDGWAPFGLLQYVVDDIDAMVRTTEIDG